MIISNRSRSSLLVKSDGNEFEECIRYADKRRRTPFCSPSLLRQSMDFAAKGLTHGDYEKGAIYRERILCTMSSREAKRRSDLRSLNG